MTISGITLVFKRSAEQEETLQSLLAAQQNPGSSSYRHWLTPEAFGAQFGAADEDIAKTEQWLRSHGFAIDSVTPSRDRITFTGSAAQVESAFGSALHYYQSERERHFAPDADLILPAELGAMTSAVLHLSDYRPKPNVKVQTHPDYTAYSNQAHYLVPADMYVMYDAAMYNLTNVYPGRGQGIAVVGQTSLPGNYTTGPIRYFLMALERT